MKLDHLSKIYKQQGRWHCSISTISNTCYKMHTLCKQYDNPEQDTRFTERFYENLRSRPEKSGAITRSPSLSVLKRSEDNNMPSPKISCWASVQQTKMIPIQRVITGHSVFMLALIFTPQESSTLGNIAMVCLVQNTTGDLNILSLQCTE